MLPIHDTALPRFLDIEPPLRGRDIKKLLLQLSRVIVDLGSNPASHVSLLHGIVQLLTKKFALPKNGFGNEVNINILLFTGT